MHCLSRARSKWRPGSSGSGWATWSCCCAWSTTQPKQIGKEPSRLLSGSSCPWCRCGCLCSLFYFSRCNRLDTFSKFVGAQWSNFAFSFESESFTKVLSGQQWGAVLLCHVKFNIGNCHIIFTIFDDRKLEGTGYL